MKFSEFESKSKTQVDEAQVATMRKYFAGDEKAKDSTKVGQMRDFFSNPKNQTPVPAAAAKKPPVLRVTKSVDEGADDTHDQGEYDREGEMAMGQLKTAEDAAAELRSILDADENLPEWVQSKITKAVDYLDTVRDYMKSKEQGVTEVSNDTLKSYQQKVSTDSMKHPSDPTKRSPEKASRSVAGFAKAQKRLEKDVAEGLDDVRKHRLYDLIELFRDATDPSDYYDRDIEDPEEVIAMIKNEFGGKIADQVASGAYKMHFPRHGIQRSDPLGLNRSPDRLTKAGKMYKQDMDYRKRNIKSRMGIDEQGVEEEQSYTGKGNHRPGWMLKADPELAKKFKDKEEKARARQRAYGDPSAGKSVKESSLDAVFEQMVQLQMNKLDEDWQKVNKRDKTPGMSRKAVKAYRRENPGSKLQTAVTTKPSKLKKGSKSAKRRKSFCARMKGMKKSRASAKTKRDPDSPINKALRRWNC